jgi:hypothetical protein
MSKSPALISLVFCLFLSGCVTYEPAVIVGNKISNKSVGYYGYEITIPAGFEPVTDGDRFDDEFWGRVEALKVKYSYTTNGIYARDFIILSNESRDVVLLLLVAEGFMDNSFSMLTPLGIREYAKLMKQVVNLDTNGAYEEVPTTGVLRMDFDGIAYEGNQGEFSSGSIILGKMNELFILQGIIKGDGMGEQIKVMTLTRSMANSLIVR